ACGNSQTVTDTVRINIFSPINIQFNPASTIIPAGGSLNLNATVTGGKGKFSYQWFNEKNQSVGYDSSLAISTEGNYTVIVKDEMSESMSSATKTISVKQSNCYQPSGFTINNIGASTVKIGWEANETVYGFKIRKRVAGEKTWSSSGTILPYNNRTLTNLIDNTPYEIQIQTVCDPMHNDTSNWSQIYSFKTKSFCNNPDSVKVISVGDTSAQLKWSVTDNAIIYKIRLRKVGDTTWILKNQSASFPCDKKLKGLEPNTTYELQMQNECYWKSGTEYTKSISFTTALAKTTEIIPVEIKPEEIGKLSIAPNPSSGIFNLDLITGDNKIYQLSIVNLIGAKVYEASVTATNGIISKSISLNNTLPKGIYLITVSNGDSKFNKRLLLNK
ncbi:MAG: fibronectin type III domain-containing protein, partial [Bacteroidota bacterium]